MRPQVVTQGAAGATAWLPINRNQNNFSIAMAATVTSGGTLTYSVQHTLDDPFNKQLCSITRSTTTATLTLTDHGITSTSDSITVVGAGAPFDGTFTVASITNANVITYTVANSGAASSNSGGGVIIQRVFNHAVMAAQTTSLDGNYAFPIAAVRLNITSYTSGKATLTVNQGK